MVSGERALGHARFLCDVAQLAATSLTRGLLTNRVVQAAVAHFADICTVYALDGSALVLRALAQRHDGARKLSSADLCAALTGEGIMRETVRTGQPLILSRDGARDSFLEKTAARLLLATSMRSMIVVPITIGASCVGVLTFLEENGAQPYDLLDLEFAIAVARQMGTALENVMLREQERRNAERTRLLARATDRLFSSTDEGDVLQLLLDLVVEELADWAIVASLHDETLSVTASAQSPAIARGRFSPFWEGNVFSKSAEQTLIAAVRAKESLFVNEISKSPAQELEPRAWMVAPLLIGGRHFGAVVCYSTAHCYDDGDLDVLQELCRRASLGLKYAESFARERRLTQTLQQATLPCNLAAVSGATLSACYLPAAQEEQVGGDWYDAFSLDEHRVLVTIGDVTGHGLHAAVIMGKLRHALNVVGMYEEDPSRVLDVAERILLRRYPEAMATAFVAVIDSSRGTVTYANAGHPAPMLRMRDGSVRMLTAGGLPVGLRDFGNSQRARSMSLDDVELMLFYTDGLTEASRDAIEGERLMTEALSEKASVLVRDPADYVKTSCMNHAPFDDVALLSLNFLAIERWSFDSEDQKAAQMARRNFRDKLRAKGVSRDDCGAAELIFGEIEANVARHAPGAVDVALEWSDSRPILHVIDRGQGYEVVQLQTADVLSEQGRGLWLVQSLGGEVHVNVLPRFGTHTSVLLPVGLQAQVA